MFLSPFSFLLFLWKSINNRFRRRSFPKLILRQSMFQFEAEDGMGGTLLAASQRTNTSDGSVQLMKVAAIGTCYQRAESNPKEVIIKRRRG